MNNQNWDDIRYVLAVAKYGSLNAAATALGVTHATVMRRVASFELRYNYQVFAKSPSGYTVLPEAISVVNAIENIDDAVLATERALVGANLSPSGKVRVASTDSICQLVLPRVLAKISQQYPQIEFSLLSGNAHHDLTQLSADIVVRPTLALDDGLTGQRVGSLGFGLFSDGNPDRKWMRLQGALAGSAPARWISENIQNDQIIGGADSFLVLSQMAAMGIGKALMPTLAGAADSLLVQDHEFKTKIEVPIWVASLEEFSQTPRIALVKNILVDLLKEEFSQTEAG